MIRRGYHGGGQLWYETLYHKKQLHGISKIWHSNGQLYYEASYYEGKKHGIAKSWSEDGKLNFKIHYLYGDRVTREGYRRHELIKKLSGL